MKPFRKALLFTALLLVFTITNSVPTDAKSHEKLTDRRITHGQVGLSFYTVVGGVVQEILKREGYTVNLIEGHHAEIFPQLDRGKVDILAAAKLPSGHAKHYAPVKKATFRITKLYEDARFFWVVPDYVPADALASIDDLKKPDVREKMPKQIVSLPEATGLIAGGRRVMEAFGLNQAGYELVAASPAKRLGVFREALENKE